MIVCFVVSNNGYMIKIGQFVFLNADFKIDGVATNGYLYRIDLRE